MVVVLVAGVTIAHAAPPAPRAASARARAHSAPATTDALLRRLPAGSAALPIESIEGVILVHATLRGAGVDTSGELVVDTGAGYLGLEPALATRLGAHDGSTPAGLALATGAVARLELGALQLDQVRPVLLVDTDVIRRVTGRDVLGLTGQRVYAGRAVFVDYDAQRMFVVPSADSSRAGSGAPAAAADTALATDAAIAGSRRLLAPLLSARARAVPFRLAGDEKLLVRVRFRDAATGAPGAWLTLVFDTGATKSVLFEPLARELHPGVASWRAVQGLVAPTLVGSPDARLVIAPVMEMDARGGAPVAERRVDCALIETPLANALSAAVGEPVAGLVGYSFFQSCRVGIDFPHRVLWLDPLAHPIAARPYEYSHVGLQLERDGDAVRVTGVADGSPAALAGIAAGDTLVRVGTRAAQGERVIEVSNLLEGPPGSAVTVVVRHAGAERRFRLVRRRLL